MLTRPIRKHDLRSHVRRRQIRVHTFPATFPLRIGKETAQHLGIQIALASEIAVEPAVRQARSGHNLLQAEVVEAVSIKQSPRAVNNSSFHFLPVAGGIRHRASRF